MDLNELSADKDKASAGVWVSYDDDASVKIRYTGSTEYSA